MPEISLEQMNQLGGKLDSLRDTLTAEERQLLLTTFGLAAQTLGNASPESQEPEAAQAEEAVLSDALRSVYFPGRVGQFQRLGARSDSVEVTGGIKWSK